MQPLSDTSLTLAGNLSISASVNQLNYSHTSFILGQRWCAREVETIVIAPGPHSPTITASSSLYDSLRRP